MVLLAFSSATYKAYLKPIGDEARQTEGRGGALSIVPPSKTCFRIALVSASCFILCHRLWPTTNAGCDSRYMHLVSFLKISWIGLPPLRISLSKGILTWDCLYLI